MKTACIYQWYSIHNKQVSGYGLADTMTEQILYEGATQKEVLQYAKDNGIKIKYYC